MADKCIGKQNNALLCKNEPLFISVATISYWKKGKQTKGAQDSYKVEQDFCVGFENWGLVPKRLAPARDEQKSCSRVLCEQGFLESHKTLNH